MEEKQGISDEMYITKWRAMLAAFEKLIKGFPAPESVKEDLMALSESAGLTNLLTPRQKTGITDRCRNYINGDYGVNKTKSQYIATHPQN